MTGDSRDYKYVSSNVPEEKINYSFSKYGGKGFLNSWRLKRKSYLLGIKNNRSFDQEAAYISLLNNDHRKSPTVKMLDCWINDIMKRKIDLTKVNLLLKRFEVTKRIYNDYDVNFRPLKKMDFRNPLAYIMFGCVLSLIYRLTSKLQYLNALLKLNDILCSIADDIEQNEKEIMQWLFQNESDYIETLTKGLH